MTVVIVAQSGRALAAAARRAGEPCHVVDLFADVDTQALAERCVRVAGTVAGGFEPTALLQAVAALPDLDGIVYGAGFEAEPALLAALAEIAPLIGNPPDTVAAVKDPLGFAAMLHRLGLPHPPTRRAAPAGKGWLVKRVGGSGGTHITHEPAGAAADRYFQRRVAGRPVSALFVADGVAARIIGFSEQWTDPTAAQPYRYGGCAAPATLAAPLAEAIEAACGALVAATGLRGLNSLDLLVDGEAWHILEINPRPGATLDIFDGVAGALLWRLHCDGAAGRLPPPRDAAPGGRAARVVYAPCRLVVPDGIVWPGWVADRSMATTVIEAGEPVCTVTAEAATAGGARRGAGRRARVILATLRGSEGFDDEPARRDRTDSTPHHKLGLQ